MKFQKGKWYYVPESENYFESWFNVKKVGAEVSYVLWATMDSEDNRLYFYYPKIAHHRDAEMVLLNGQNAIKLIENIFTASKVEYREDT